PRGSACGARPRREVNGPRRGATPPRCDPRAVWGRVHSCPSACQRVWPTGSRPPSEVLSANRRSVVNAASEQVKFRVERDVLAEAVTWTTKALPQRPSSPVLTGVLITAEADGTVRLAVFDYEISSRTEISADVEAAGTFLVSGRLLADISKALPNQAVTDRKSTRLNSSHVS